MRSKVAGVLQNIGIDPREGTSSMRRPSSMAAGRW
jgi:hypothetical protein